MQCVELLFFLQRLLILNYHINCKTCPKCPHAFMIKVCFCNCMTEYSAVLIQYIKKIPFSKFDLKVGYLQLRNPNICQIFAFLIKLFLDGNFGRHEVSLVTFSSEKDNCTR